MIQALHGRLTLPPNTGNNALLVPVIWNGQDPDLGLNCLTNYANKDLWDTDGICPDLPDDITTYTGSQSTGSCAGGATVGGAGAKRDDTGVCPIPSNGGGGVSINCEYPRL